MEPGARCELLWPACAGRLDGHCRSISLPAWRILLLRLSRWRAWSSDLLAHTTWLHSILKFTKKTLLVGSAHVLRGALQLRVDDAGAPG
eukprot:768626-Hanusia_phi.AAC.2